MLILKTIFIISLSFSAGAGFMAWWLNLKQKEKDEKKTMELLADLNDLHRRNTQEAGCIKI